MADRLPDEEIIAIIEEYDDTGNMAKVSDSLDFSTSTVQKYVNSWKEGLIEIDEDEIIFHEPEGPPPGFTAEPPGGEESIDDDKPDFNGMTHGDFIRWFFDQDGFGVQQSFANTLARKCNVRGKIPDQAEMANELMNGNSRISNGHQAESVSEVYWDAAQRFLDAKGERVQPQSASVGLGGSWQSEMEGVGGEGPGGSWVGSSPGQSQGGTAQRTQGQSGYGGHQVPPGPNQQPRPGTGGQELQQLIDTVQDLKETQVRIMQSLGNDQDSSQDVRTMKERIDEMAEIQKTLETMHGNDGPDEQVQALRQELQSIRDEMAMDAQQDVTNGEGLAGLAQLAAQGDIDPETLSVLAEFSGVTDPEVKKAEFELQKEQEKLKSRKELVDAVFENLGDVSGELMSALLTAFSGGGQQQTQDGQAEQRDPHQQQGRQVRTVDAGSAGVDEGDFQVVGGQPDDGGGQQMQSPAERKHRDAVREGQTQRYRGPRASEPADAGGQDGQTCEWVENDGTKCGAPVAEPGDTLCQEHRQSVSDSPTGDFQ